jgi:hypothetical protein
VPWIALYVGIVVLGLVVLALLGYRLYQQVRQFARDVGAAGERIAAATADRSQIDPSTPSKS